MQNKFLIFFMTHQKQSSHYQVCDLTEGLWIEWEPVPEEMIQSLSDHFASDAYRAIVRENEERRRRSEEEFYGDGRILH